MIFKKNHFPIFFSFLFFVSCNKITDLQIDQKNEAYKIYIGKGDVKKELRQYDSAFYYYSKAKDASKESEANNLICALGRMADIQKIQSDYYGAEETATEALKYFEKSDRSDLKCAINVILGIISDETHDYDKAIDYYNKSIYDSISDNYLATIKNNIGVVYIDKKEYKKAIDVLKPLSESSWLQSDKVIFAKVIDNLGFSYFKSNNPSGIKYLKQSLAIRDSINDDSEKIASYIHLSQYYLNSNQALSLDFAQKAYRSANKTKSGDDKLEALDLILRNSKKTDVFKKNYKLFYALNDSIVKERQMAKNQFSKIKFDSSKALQETENQAKKKIIYLLLFVLTFITSFFLFIWFRKNSLEKLKIVSYETETRISKRIHDELANDVFNALTFAETQNLQDPNNKEILLENLDAIYARTRNISKENSEIDTGKDFVKHLIQLLVQYESNSVNVIIHKITSIEWEMVKKEVKIALYRVLQELMVNMKKHSNCNVVILRFENQKSQIEVYYSDNGKGIKMLKSKKGLQNAENRIHALKGTITFDFETATGFKVKLAIPK